MEEVLQACIQRSPRDHFCHVLLMTCLVHRACQELIETLHSLRAIAALRQYATRIYCHPFNSALKNLSYIERSLGKRTHRQPHLTSQSLFILATALTKGVSSLFLMLRPPRGQSTVRKDGSVPPTGTLSGATISAFEIDSNPLLAQSRRFLPWCKRR